MRVFLNLVAGTAAGQLTRARAFLDRFHHYAPSIQLVVAKEQSVLTEYATTEKRLVVDVRIGSGRFKAVNRVWWENTAMSQLALLTTMELLSISFGSWCVQPRTVFEPRVD